MEIRLATSADLPMMKEIFEIGRNLQIQTGNVNQWEKGYPSESLLLEDISKAAAYVCVKESEIIGTFSLFEEPISIYKQIDGSWISDEPYATIQRVASNGKVKGTGKYCIRWVQKRHHNIRISTHENNLPMRRLLQKLDFQYRGVIYWENGTSRNAYQYIKK